MNITSQNDARSVYTDVVIIGAGVAGLRVALSLTNTCQVAVLTTGKITHDSSSALAQGGIAAALSVDDSASQHTADTLCVAAGLSDIDRVHLLTAAARDQIAYLNQLGMPFVCNTNQDFVLAKEAAHSKARVVHAHDATGKALMDTLQAAVAHCPNIVCYEHSQAIALLQVADQVVGVVVQTQQHRVCYYAKAVVLATGGIGGLYAHTTNPLTNTGTGLALAAQAGAALVDLEFMQFHPTALAIPTTPLPLVTEALRGAGAVLCNQQGKRLRSMTYANLEMAPRDMLARTIWQQLQDDQSVYLDARRLQQVKQRFPNVTRMCAQHGMDIASDLLPVTPAAHYHMGGVWVDTYGASTVPGLWACGEVACTGVHGANRLASNSLLEALVFGERVAQNINATCLQDQAAIIPRQESALGTVGTGLPMSVRDKLWEYVGIVRDAQGLQQLLHTINLFPVDSIQVRQQCLVIRCLVTAAQLRHESRGSHFRSDYPMTKANYQKRLLIRVTSDDTIAPQFIEVNRETTADSQSVNLY